MNSSKLIGIPRALLCYYYYPAWATFFTELGCKVALSPHTSRKIVDTGVQLAVDEACMPVKLFFGHAASLLDTSDYIFIPRLVGVENRAFICPKFMGLPDMIRAVTPPDAPAILSPCIDLSRGNRAKKVFREMMNIGLLFSSNQHVVRRAYEMANKVQLDSEALFFKGYFPDEIASMLLGPRSDLDSSIPSDLAEIAAMAQEREKKEARVTIGVIGHPYLLYDDYTNMAILPRLSNAGCKVITSDMIPWEIIEDELKSLPRWLFWTMGRRLVGAAFHFLHSGRVDGCIHISAFGCGLDSVVGEIIEMEAKRSSKIPLTKITLDEHSGEAGVVTRLEAFLDMINRRKSA
ncbi:MAG TPA: hypothetical protein GX509_05335 [Firmicutes bacterium]|nr:hypothetical protein [Bacillota bacterium]